MSTTEPSCARHPGTQTRLSCSQCGTPICPRCAVSTPVGQKCPDCARQPRSVRASGKPRQYGKAVAAGLGAATLGAVALWLLIGTVGFLTWIGSGVVGYLIARAVMWGAEGNRADTFRWLAIGLSVVAVAAAWLALGVLLPRGLSFLTYAAAGYGAWLRFSR